MPMILGLMADCSGLIHPKLPFQIQQYSGGKSKNYNAIRLISNRVFRARIQYFLSEDFGTKYVTSAGRNHHELSFDDDFPKESFWLTLLKESFRALNSLFAFLVEQPSQLKYIEWPNFQSTLKTASLTLVLVALLIVALSSVDSAFSYLLALLLRRTP